MENDTLVIDVTGLNKRFGSRQVVKNLSLQVRRGEIYGFLGPNGSGKTTSIRMVCGLLTPDSGSGTCLGYDVLTQSAMIKREVGYMTQRFSLWEDLTIAENLDFIARMHAIPGRRQKVAMAIERLGLTGRHQQLAGSLSGGWKQRLALAACMLHEPRLLLLDEPTAGVDPKARREFWDQIFELAGAGVSVLVSTHYMDEAERCTRLAYIAYGELLTSGSAQEMIAREGLTAWEVSGPDLPGVAHRLHESKAAEQVSAFGNTLHVVGHDPSRLLEALAPWRADSRYRTQPIDPGLEDVFINLMSRARDNFRS